MRDLLYFVIGILPGLICIFFDGSAVMAQSTGTECFALEALRECDPKIRIA